MAGGGGTRLWPLSSPERPKPFLPLLGDRTLLQLSADRLKGLIDPSSIYVVTDRRYERLVREQLPKASILSEPVGRNTAAAIAFATIAIDRPDDEVMLVLPADQTVQDVPQFREVLREAHEELAQRFLGVRQPLVTLGVETKRPATEYGYLIPDPGRSQKHGLIAYVLKAFQEKPSHERAVELLARGGGVAWNAGMFMWQRRAIRRALRDFAPQVLDPIADGFRSGALSDAYAKIESISIDYAVMEKAARDRRVVMGSMDVGWNDLGSWTTLLGELGMPGIDATIARPGEPFAADDEDLVIWRPIPERLVSRAGADATMTGSGGPVAVLRRARPFQVQIDALLDRCSSPEAHP